jgi:HEAT repeat protein
MPRAPAPRIAVVVAAAALACTLLAPAGRAQEDLEALWRDASLWEVGSNAEKVPAARAALIALGDRALDFIIPARLDTRDGLVIRALQTVVKGIGPAAVPRLLACLESPAADVRRNAALLLGHLGAVEAAPAIARLLSDRDARLGALAALGALSARDAAQEVAALAASDDPDVSERVRVTATSTLGALAGDAAVAALLEALASASAPVRFAAQAALERLKAVPALRSRVHAGDRRVRLHAIAALGRIADPAASGDLASCVDDPDPVVRGFVVEALGACGGLSAGAAGARLAAEHHPFVRGKLQAIARDGS